MIKHRIMEAEGIVLVEPLSALSADDFRDLSASVDAYLTERPAIHGLLIHAKKFPGWKSFAGLAAHIRFVREHHREVKRVALVSDSSLTRLAQALAKHFVSAEVRRFPYSGFDDALLWLKSE